MFEHCTLAMIGVGIQVGPHPPGRICAAGHVVEKFTVIHTNGIHTIRLRYCSCSHAPERYIQLLRAGIFPNTPLEPASGVTFAALRLFHRLSLQGKLTGYDFIKSLEILTDNTGLRPPPVSFSQIIYSDNHSDIFPVPHARVHAHYPNMALPSHAQAACPRP